MFAVLYQNLVISPIVTMSTPSLDSLNRDRNTKPVRRSPAWLLPLGILLGFALLFSFLFKDRILPAQEVQATRVLAIPEETDPAAQRSDDRSPLLFQASGWVEADPWAVKATSLIDGVIDEVHVLEGQRVDKGDLIASMITEDYELALLAAERELKRRQSAREAHCAGIPTMKEEKRGIEAQLESIIAVRDGSKDRLDRLERSGSRAVPERDIVDARLDYQRVKALVGAAESKVRQISARLTELDFETEGMIDSIEAARISVDQAKLALSRTEIRAPITGRILRLHVTPGQKRMLGMDDPESSTIAVLYDPKKLQVRVDVPLADASGLSIGQPTRIRCNFLPDQVFLGRVTRIVGEADLQRNTLQAKVAIENPHDSLRPEMLCRVEFLENRNPESDAVSNQSRDISLYVDQSAIDGDRVWVIDPDSRRVEPRDITLGRQKESNRLVTSGLRPGERVVLRPENLRSGQRVNPIQQ